MRTCMSCGEEADYYKLLDPIWNRVADREGDLCLPCVEARLGRPLAPDDFLFTPLEMAIRLTFKTRDLFKAWSLVLGEKTTDHALFNRLLAPDQPLTVAAAVTAITEFYDKLRATARR